MITIEKLSREKGTKIKIETIKDTITKLGGKKRKEKAIEKSRDVFRKQLNDLMAWDSLNTAQHPKGEVTEENQTQDVE